MANRVAFPEKELIVTVPHKCGSTSFQVATVPGLAELTQEVDLHVGDIAVKYWHKKGIGPLFFDDVFTRFPDFDNLIAVRDPVTRFMSTWDDFCFRTKDSSEAGYDWLRGLSPSEFLTFIEKCPGGDSHWWPQNLMALPDTDYIDYRHLLQFLGLPHVHVHGGRRPKDRYELTEEEVERLRRMYPFDFDMWEKAQAGWKPC